MDPGEGPRGPAPSPPPTLFLDQAEAQRTEKIFLETIPPPPYLRVWTANPPVISRSGSGTATNFVSLHTLHNMMHIKIHYSKHMQAKKFIIYTWILFYISKNFEYLSIYLFICLSVYLSVCLSVYLSIYLRLLIPVWCSELYLNSPKFLLDGQL